MLPVRCWLQQLPEIHIVERVLNEYDGGSAGDGGGGTRSVKRGRKRERGRGITEGRSHDFKVKFNLVSMGFFLCAHRLRRMFV